MPGRSREGAWIEMSRLFGAVPAHHRRSREGAWIEILITPTRMCWRTVAPVRERGLKYFPLPQCAVIVRRSREGAWIEITPVNNGRTAIRVAPVRERGLKCRLRH